MLGRSAAVAGAAALLASLADLAAASIEVDEEGVMHNRGGLVEARDFDLKKLKAVHSGTHDQADVGSSYRIHYDYDGERISPWHDIPLDAGGFGAGKMTFHFLCEIPKGETAKFEVHKSYGHNPVAQDHKKGTLRHYKYGPSIVNYGAIMQTWEDPNKIHPDTGAGGDNDPIDVLQISDTPCELGEVMPVRVLGTLALVDGGETDWKVIVVDARDKSSDAMQEIEDVPEAKVSEMREWFRNYKTAEGKGVNTFGLEERAMPRKYAEKVIMETHESWIHLTERESGSRACPPASSDMSSNSKCGCMFDDAPCWVDRHEATVAAGMLM